MSLGLDARDEQVMQLLLFLVVAYLALCAAVALAALAVALLRSRAARGPAGPRPAAIFYVAGWRRPPRPSSPSSATVCGCCSRRRRGRVAGRGRPSGPHRRWRPTPSASRTLPGAACVASRAGWQGRRSRGSC